MDLDEVKESWRPGPKPRGYWSITMYDTEHFFVPNDIKRRRNHDYYSSRSAGREPADIRA